MKQYTKPEFDVVVLNMNDIIATSDPVLGIIDGENNDPTMLGAPGRAFGDFDLDFFE